MHVGFLTNGNGKGASKTRAATGEKKREIKKISNELRRVEAAKAVHHRMAHLDLFFGPSFAAASKHILTASSNTLVMLS